MNYHRHTQSTPSVADIDAAAMEFERRFHISVDASEDREQQVIRNTQTHSIHPLEIHTHTNTHSLENSDSNNDNNENHNEHYAHKPISIHIHCGFSFCFDCFFFFAFPMVL